MLIKTLRGNAILKSKVYQICVLYECILWIVFEDCRNKSSCFKIIFDLKMLLQANCILDSIDYSLIQPVSYGGVNQKRPEKQGQLQESSKKAQTPQNLHNFPINLQPPMLTPLEKNCIGYTSFNSV